MSLASHENEDWINGEKTEDIVAFLDRLYTAKRKVEKRIVILGGEADPVCFHILSHNQTNRLYRRRRLAHIMNLLPPLVCPCATY